MSVNREDIIGKEHDAFLQERSEEIGSIRREVLTRTGSRPLALDRMIAGGTLIVAARRSWIKRLFGLR